MNQAGCTTLLINYISNGGQIKGNGSLIHSLKADNYNGQNKDAKKRM
jgi:hypothetical protein